MRRRWTGLFAAGVIVALALRQLWPLALAAAAAALDHAIRMLHFRSRLQEVFDAIADHDWDRARASAHGVLGASLDRLVDAGEARERALQDAIQRERMKALELELHSTELEEARTRLEYANKDLEAFTYSASHDLAAPMKTIVSFAELVLDDEGLNDDTRGHVDSMRRIGSRVLGLINDLLVISRLRAPDRADVRSVALGDLVAEIAAGIQADIPGDARLLVDGILPRAQVPPERIMQVLQNLIRNGFKFNRSGAPTVIVQGWSEGDMIVLRVSDNGIGIASHDPEQVFGLFTRLVGSEFAGSGAGLAIARRAARSLGGDLWVERSSPTGTTFAFAFPSEYRADIPTTGFAA